MTIRSTDVPELDIAGVSAAYERRVREACPEQLPLAMRLLERLPPARWTLEWHLPWWLGHAFGLDREIAREVVLSNLLGLGSIRLQDDLADGEVRADDVEAARILSAMLYEAALLPYRARFDPGSPFWSHLESCMTEWGAATRGNAPSGSTGTDVADPGRSERRLAAPAAPLKISAFAVCLLADRADAFPGLEGYLDHALEAMVLYDHVADWEADLDAGRWNAFVAGTSSGPQLPEHRERHRRAVLVAMMTTDAVAAHFARVEDGMLRAAALAETLGVPVPPLGAYFREFATSVNEQGTALQEHYRSLADRAAKLLLQATVEARSWDRHPGGHVRTEETARWPTRTSPTNRRSTNRTGSWNAS